jgi:hypothetical protein
MSTAVTSPPAETNQFNYKVVSPLSPLTVVLGVMSLFGFLTAFVIPLALIGCVMGILCLGKIKRLETEYGGKVLTSFGVALCTVSFLGGTAWQFYSYATEVPEGHTRVSFISDISRKQFREIEGEQEFHPDVSALDGKSLFFKGYMYPDGKLENIDVFILVKDSGQCCFGGNPKLSDMVKVVMRKDSGLAKYYPGLVSVAGTFKLKDIRRGGDLVPVYELEATHFCESKNLY